MADEQQGNEAGLVILEVLMVETGEVSPAVLQMFADMLPGTVFAEEATGQPVCRCLEARLAEDGLHTRLEMLREGDLDLETLVPLDNSPQPPPPGPMVFGGYWKAAEGDTPGHRVDREGRPI